MFTGGAAVQWLRDGLGLVRAASETEELALSVPDTGGVYFVPAFSGLGAPWWDMYARGTIVGITRGTTRAHIVRAALEAIAYQSADLLNAMEADAGIRLATLKADGGASANNFLMQFQADLAGQAGHAARVRGDTAMGAAYLAGLKAGIFSGLAGHRGPLARGAGVPAFGRCGQAQASFAGWHRAVDRARNGWRVKRGTGLSLE